jgi:integrase
LDSHNVARTSFKPLLERAELPDIRFHDLRHTCATLLLSRGHHPKLVQELLCHASVALTLDRYSHVLPGMGTRPPQRWRLLCPRKEDHGRVLGGLRSKPSRVGRD